ncbi:MAG: hypothetical protein GY882_06905, partial [Actinomycetia bacterium]|nr:hypothetical protein [Actinomycetes bacterium]
MVALLLACTWIGGEEHADRLDGDRDGFLGFDDCDDTDPDHWQSSIVYADEDGDGRGAGDPIEICGDPGDHQAMEDG